MIITPCMKKIIPALLALLVLTCCTNDDAPKKKAGSVKKTGKKNEQAKKSNVKLDLFRMPAFIDGCAELLTYDTCKAKDKYIFATDYGDNTIIKIKGKEIRLTRDTAGLTAITGKDFVHIFRGSGYKVTLKLKMVKQYDEGAAYKGTLQLTGNKTDATFKVKGTGGC